MEEIQDIISDFTITDNVPVDFEFRKEVCGEDRACLQLDSKLATQLKPFMKSGTHDDGCGLFLLNEPIVIELKVDVEIWKVTFRTFVIYIGKIPPPGPFAQTGRIRLKINSWPSSHVKAPRTIIWGQKGVLFIKSPNGEIIDLRKIIIQAITEFNEYSLFELVKDISPYNTPEKVSRFFGNLPDIFESLKLSATTRLDSFHDHKQSRCSELERLLDFNPDWSEKSLLQDLLHDFVFKNKRDFALTRAHEKIYGGWLRQVISFENEFSEIVMIVIKLYFPQSQTKILVPVTNWMERYSPRNKLYCVPLPDKQILLHLKQLLTDDVSTVIISTIEIASVNQVNAPKGVVWTSFLCSPGEYSQVDFSPLQKEGVEIFLLITSHFGMSLEESYIKAKGLAKYLIAEYGLTLRFVQVKVHYHEKPLYFNSISDIMDHRREYPPTIIADSIIVMNSYDEFNMMYQKAEQRLNLTPFWINDESDSGVSENTPVSDKLQAIPFAFRPIWGDAKVCLVRALTETGKTCFIYSMCAAYVSGQKPIVGNTWNVMSLSKYKYNKVIYLDFESSQALINRRRKQFVLPYFPTDTEDRRKCVDNLIFKDLKDDITNFSEPANHQRIIDMITAAKNDGEKGQMPGLVVIDTYGNLVKNENPSSWSKVETLIKKITMLGISVIIVGHSSADGKRMEGFAKKVHSCDSEIKLSRANANTTTLEAPMLVEIGKNRICETKIEKQPFYIHFDKKWKLFDPDASDQADVDLKQAELQEFGLTVKEYRAAEYSDLVISEMLGYKKSAFYEKLKKYNACKEVL